MRDGIFITVEGSDGAGKSTQLEFIKDYLEEKGENALFTREPGGTPISEKIRTIILDRHNAEMSPITEMLLYAASRAQHVEQLIGPALSRGRIVVCDRFVDSSIAYQGYGRGLGDSVSVVNSFAIGQCVPDVTFLLKLDPEKSASRIRENDRDRLESEDLEFHRAVYRGYLELERKFPDRVVGIDADGTIDQISMQIESHLDRILKGRHDISE
ncbi:MAG: dTMP kinase [Eubacteriaceae bacterium]|nr:dTMP kinase [Eubacteriaceae bacterium]